MVTELTDSYRITGRIRDERGREVEGFVVQGFDKDLGIYLHPDDRLGKDETKEDGRFQIDFSKAAFKDWFEQEPNVYLQIRDIGGREIINTTSKKNTTGRMDFQIKLARLHPNPLEPDLYANGLQRMMSGLRSVGDAIDLSRDDVKNVFELLGGVLGAWTSYRDEIVRVCGYDGIQVPEQPRRVNHYHVTRWDEAVLP